MAHTPLMAALQRAARQIAGEEQPSQPMHPFSTAPDRSRADGRSSAGRWPPALRWDGGSAKRHRLQRRAHRASSSSAVAWPGSTARIGCVQPATRRRSTRHRAGSVVDAGRSPVSR